MRELFDWFLAHCQVREMVVNVDGKISVEDKCCDVFADGSIPEAVKQELLVSLSGIWQESGCMAKISSKKQ